MSITQSRHFWRLCSVLAAFRVASVPLFLLSRKRERHLLIFRVEQSYLEGIGFGKLEILPQFLLASKFRDMDKPRDTLLDRSERAMLIEFDDDTLYYVIFLILLGVFNPRIFLERLDREGNLALFYLDYPDAHFIPHFL